MKILIWLGCLFFASVLQTQFARSGIHMGGIPTVVFYGCFFALATALCKKYDQSRKKNNPDPNEAENSTTGSNPSDDSENSPLREDQLLCPHCGKVQNKSRSMCFYCGKPLDGAGTLPDASNVSAPVVPEYVSPGLIKCPVCGKVQKEGRQSCWQCGSLLAVPDSAEVSPTQDSPAPTIESSAQQPPDQTPIAAPQPVPDDMIQDPAPSEEPPVSEEAPHPAKNIPSKESDTDSKHPEKAKRTVQPFLIVLLVFFCISIAANIFLGVSLSRESDLHASDLQQMEADQQTLINDYEEQMSSYRSEIASLKNRVNRLETYDGSYKEALTMLSLGNIGYASSNFHCSESIITLRQDELNRKVTLTANWYYGGTVYTNSTFFPTAPSYYGIDSYITFDSDSWSTSTPITIHPGSVGLTVITFTNSVDSGLFRILINVVE